MLNSLVKFTNQPQLISTKEKKENEEDQTMVRNEVSKFDGDLVLNIESNQEVLISCKEARLDLLTSE